MLFTTDLASSAQTSFREQLPCPSPFLSTVWTAASITELTLCSIHLYCTLAPRLHLPLLPPPLQEKVPLTAFMSSENHPSQPVQMFFLPLCENLAYNPFCSPCRARWSSRHEQPSPDICATTWKVLRPKLDFTNQVHEVLHYWLGRHLTHRFPILWSEILKREGHSKTIILWRTYLQFLYLAIHLGVVKSILPQAKTPINLQMICITSYKSHSILQWKRNL